MYYICIYILCVFYIVCNRVHRLVCSNYMDSYIYSIHFALCIFLNVIKTILSCVFPLSCATRMCT